MTTGKVFIVGAGPGNPDLITIKGASALRQADVILYDALAEAVLQAHASDRATCINVNNPPTASPNKQRQINHMLIDFARLGKRVVRLKGGDPFVFGDGCEEALALGAAAIPFEVIPGISASIAVPGAALIPVTHPGISTAFAVFAGPDDDESSADGTDWEIAARISTAVFLSGVERLPVIVAELLAHGRGADTPIAVIGQGTLTQQQVISGTLRNILALARDTTPPATVIVGDVVPLREQILRCSQDAPGVAAIDAESDDAWQAWLEAAGAPPVTSAKLTQFQAAVIAYPALRAGYAITALF